MEPRKGVLEWGREGKQESELQKGFKREEKGGQGRGGYRKGKERLKGKE